MNRRIVETLVEDMAHEGRASAFCRVIPDQPRLNNATLSLQAKLRRAPLTVTGTSNFPMFTDYVVVRTGNELDDVRGAHRARITAEILAEADAPRGMFRRLATFLLPDASEAVVFKVRSAFHDSASAERVIHTVRARVDDFIRQYVRSTEGYEVHVVCTSDAEARRGVVESIRVRAMRGELGDFKFQSRGVVAENLDFEIRGVRLDPAALLEAKQLRIFGVDALRVSGVTLRAEDLVRYVEATSKDVRITSLRIHDGVIRIEGAASGGPEFSLGVQMVLDSRSELRFSFVEASVQGVPIPAFLLNQLTDTYNPLVGKDATPLELDLGSLTLDDDAIRITNR